MMTGCGLSYDFAYDPDSSVTSFRLNDSNTEGRADSFAGSLCITDGNDDQAKLDLGENEAAGLFDLKNAKTVYGQNLLAQMQPASLTKVMTALVAIQNCQPDQILTATSNVNITESGAQVAGLKAGDKMTLDQALHILLIESANDAAVLIAENVGGSVDGFTKMMNDEAQKLGATGCHFVNPNGLTVSEHYVTAYDMYLIFNAASQYELFNQIIAMPTYSTEYYDGSGNKVSIEAKTTDQYVKGTVKAPDNITVIGGKTGTTDAAGHCLILYVKNAPGDPYIAVILNTKTVDELYDHMNKLLALIG
jgi:D-alanyl-D-alanine carboxypeptidase